MTPAKITEAEALALEQEVALPTRLPITRVWKESFGAYWAELWLPRDVHDPPSPFPDLLQRPDWPDHVPGYERKDLCLRSTRRTAERSARRMAERHIAGLHPTVDKPVATVRAWNFR